MKVVLATAPDEWSTKDHLPALSLGYIASVLEGAGHGVTIIDSPAYRYTVGKACAHISMLKPDAVGITATTHNRFSAVDMCNQIKQKTNALIFVGGPHFAATAHDALQNVPSIDVVVRGEGEFTARELLAAYAHGNDFQNVMGLTYRDASGRITDTPDRPFIQDLDTLPLPAWHLFDLTRYTARLEGEYKTHSIGVISSRGCPYQCTFCVNRAHWKCRLRYRSPEKFVAEIEFLHKKHGYSGFDIWDDTLTVSRKHVMGVCEEIQKRKLDIVWYARARVDTVDSAVLKVMKQSGCQAISFGVESGSQPILVNVKKKITIDQAKETIKTAASMDFYVKAFFMFSLPGETPEDIMKTLKLMDELSSYSPRVWCMGGYTLVYPGTELELLAKEQGLLPEDFQWNQPHLFERSKLVKANPSIPVYENPDLPLEQIIKTANEERYRLSRLIPMGFHRLRQIRDFSALRIFLNEIKNTLGERIRQ